MKTIPLLMALVVLISSIGLIFGRSVTSFETVLGRLADDVPAEG